jgi:hypothetical protein
MKVFFDLKPVNPRRWMSRTSEGQGNVALHVVSNFINRFWIRSRGQAREGDNSILMFVLAESRNGEFTCVNLIPRGVSGAED